jgi:Lrp/AsnC family transcriptional regulator, leucine-responsive regulatory protein
MKLDEFDARILTDLQANSKLTAEQIGRRVGLSGSAVQKRLRQFSESGLIERYVAVLNLDLIGPLITAVVTCVFDPDGPLVREKFAELLEDRPEVTNVWVLTGGLDVALTVTTRTVEECAGVIRSLQEEFPQLKDVKEYIAIRQSKRSLRVPVPFEPVSKRG